MRRKELIVSLSPNRLRRFNKKWIRRKAILKFNQLPINPQTRHAIFNEMRKAINTGKNESLAKISFTLCGYNTAQIKVIKAFISLNAANFLLNVKN